MPYKVFTKIYMGKYYLLVILTFGTSMTSIIRFEVGSTESIKSSKHI